MIILDRGLQADRVLETWARSSEEGRTGSGYLVGARAVLTAHHCVGDVIRRGGVLEVRRLTRDGSSIWLPARAAWWSEEHDVALLELDEGFPVEPVVWGDVQGTDPVACRAVGFPEREARGGVRDSDQVEGSILPLSGYKQGELVVRIDDAGIAAGTLALQQRTAPLESLWSGLSGAALFCGTRLVGIVRRDHLPVAYSGTRLRAVSVAPLLGQDPGFRATAARLGLQTVARLVSGLGRAYTGPAFQQLSAAYLDPSGLIDEVGAEGFTGREWLLSDLDERIQTTDDGYLIISAAAGWGKTVLAAHLAVTRGYPCHFSRLPRGRDPGSAMRNLAAQIIRDHDLEELAPNGFLPPAAAELGWLDTVLRAAAQQREADGVREPLVLVIDGVDDLEETGSGPPLGLTERLPSGVHVILTCRTGALLPWTRPPDHRWTLHTADERNIADMRAYLAKRSHETEIVAALDRTGMLPGHFIDLAIERCDGVWVYLHYLLSEISSGLRSPIEVEQLPTGLWRYYSQQFWELSQRDRNDWNEHLLPVLATLAVAGEPLNTVVICELAGRPLSTYPRVESFLGGWMRRFLSTTTDVDDRQYAVYHPSVAEFLSGQRPAQPSDEEYGLREELRQAALLRHQEIADFYLTSWGGLAGGLPQLAADLALSAVHNGYGRRQLPRHLTAAGRDAKLHELLACKTHLQGTEREANLWYQLHDHDNDIEGYIQTLEYAQREAEHAVDIAVAGHHTAPDLANEIRCRLISASIRSSLLGLTSVASVRGLELTPLNVVTLVQALVDSGAWSAARALAELGYSDDDVFTPLGYARLSPQLPVEVGARLFNEAVRRSTGNPRVRSEVLASFGPGLPEDTLTEALRLATELEQPQYRLDALAPLARRRPERLPEVLALVREWKDHGGAEALETVAPAISQDQLDEALELVHAITWFPSQFRAAAAVYARLPNAAARQEGFSELLGALPQTAEDFLATSQQRSVKRLLPLYLQLSDDFLPNRLADQLWGLDNDRAEFLGYLAPHLPQELVSRAIEQALQTGTDWYRARALVALVPRITDPVEREQIVAQIIRDATTRHRNRDRLHYRSQVYDDVHNYRVLMNRVPEGTKMPRSPVDGWCMETLSPLLRCLPPGSAEHRRVEAAYYQAAERFDPNAWRTRDLIRFSPAAPAGLLLRFLDRIRYVGGDDLLARAEAAMKQQLRSVSQSRPWHRVRAGRTDIQFDDQIRGVDDARSGSPLEELRARVSVVDRNTACASLIQVSGAIASLGGETALRDCISALRDVRSWWP